MMVCPVYLVYPVCLVYPVYPVHKRDARISSPIDVSCLPSTR
jgi:hypothetical protein